MIRRYRRDHLLMLAVLLAFCAIAIIGKTWGE